MSHAGGPPDHITPYDRMALPERALVELLAAPDPHAGLLDYFGAVLYTQLTTLARESLRPRATPGRRVYVLPGIMGSQLGFTRGDQRPDDVLWLDPIDISFGRLAELRLDGSSPVLTLGAMNYTYLKLTLALRVAGYDAVLLDYDWRHDIASLGRLLAQRIARDGQDNVALIGHSMGGLVARAALTHREAAGVTRLVMLGTPNSGSLAAVQALRGTYSVVRKLAQLDLRHDAEYLAAHVFSTFPGLHELLPASGIVSDANLFDIGSWPAGAGPAPGLLKAATNLSRRMAEPDERFAMVVGCNRATATRLALRDGEFEYEYTLEGDGTVPMSLAQLPGAHHAYVDCDHSDMPLADEVIRGTIDLLEADSTARFASQPVARPDCVIRVRDSGLRELFNGKVDWPHMTPAQRREFLDTLNEPPWTATLDA